jgi:hypothetical protein
MLSLEPTIVAIKFSSNPSFARAAEGSAPVRTSNTPVYQPITIRGDQVGGCGQGSRALRFA